MDKKELKQPDEFVSFGTRAARYAAENSVQVVGGALLLVVLIASFFGWLQRRDAREVEAAGALYQADKVLEVPQMDNMFRGMKLPGISSPTPEKYKEAIAKYDEVAAKYPGTKAALRAKAKAGDAYVELEQWDDAIKSYDEAFGGSPLERAYALNGKAHAQERKGDHDGASATYRRLKDDPEAFARDLATLDLARALENAGKKDAAIQVLSTFSSEFPDSTLKSDAERRLAALGGTPVATSTAATSGTGGT